jgi:hypothetical protein
MVMGPSAELSEAIEALKNRFINLMLTERSNHLHN